MIIKFSLVLAAVASTHAFLPTSMPFRSVTPPRSSSVDVDEIVQTKPTGTSFLPEETVERAKVGSPIEKIKLEKDGTAAFVDVYEYARKIREGEMTWEEVEKADLDSVSWRCPVTFAFCLLAVASMTTCISHLQHSVLLVRPHSA